MSCTAVIHQGDVLDRLRELPDGSVHCCVTSDPYWGLRDYKLPVSDWPEVSYQPIPGLPPITLPAWRGCYGLEPTPEMYVGHSVLIRRELWRVLRDDGVHWLNLGDSYNAYNAGSGPGGWGGARDQHRPELESGFGLRCKSIKPKDLVGIPWRVAFALQGDGWYLRGDHVWGKPNGMPESVRDRATRSHEYVFLFSKSERYWYDSEAVRTAPKASTEIRLAQDIDNQTGSERGNGGAKTNGTMKAVGRSDKQRGHSRRHDGFNDRWDAMEREDQMSDGANLRSVWWISPAQYAEAHFAVMPDKLATICILAGSSDHCCDACGTPWNRIVQKERKPTRPGSDTKVTGTTNAEHGNRDPQRHVTESRTLGWEPSCKCSAGVIPCTVLDPFAGSGTTLLVARKLGRSSIGIELNPQYIELAQKRINSYAPLFSTPNLESTA